MAILLEFKKRFYACIYIPEKKPTMTVPKKEEKKRERKKEKQNPLYWMPTKQNLKLILGDDC
jgi:hypothetical protein